VALQCATVALGLAPLGWLAYRALNDQLGANPIEAITHATGDAALRLLIATLAVTPARRWLRLHALAPLRRTLGLLAFFYATLHFLTYVWLDHYFDWDAIREDLAERPYATAGFFALVCLTPLAVTSTRGMIRRLGRHWKTLHRLAYVAAFAAVVHYVWLVKADLRAPLAYALVLAVLLAARAPWRRAQRALKPGPRSFDTARG
jgi:methionine sulfoxide reductase heme-binding subunit